MHWEDYVLENLSDVPDQRGLHVYCDRDGNQHVIAKELFIDLKNYIVNDLVDISKLIKYDQGHLYLYYDRKGDLRIVQKPRISFTCIDEFEELGYLSSLVTHNLLKFPIKVEVPYN